MRRSRLVAGLLAGAAVVVPAGAAAAPAAAHDDEVGGATTVVLDPDLLPVLVDTLKVAPIAPGTLSAPGGVAQVAFPITEVERGVVSHEGGLSFRPVGGGDLDVERFKVDTNTGFLTARATLNGRRLKDRVPVFRLGAVQPIRGAAPPCDGIAAGLTLTAEAAGALNAPSFAGAFVGDACVVPVAKDDDDDGRDDDRNDEHGDRHDDDRDEDDDDRGKDHDRDRDEDDDDRDEDDRDDD